MLDPVKEDTFQRGTAQVTMTPIRPRTPRATHTIWTPTDPILEKEKKNQRHEGDNYSCYHHCAIFTFSSAFSLILMFMFIFSNWLFLSTTSQLSEEGRGIPFLIGSPKIRVLPFFHLCKECACLFCALLFCLIAHVQLTLNSTFNSHFSAVWVKLLLFPSFGWGGGGGGGVVESPALILDVRTIYVLLLWCYCWSAGVSVWSHSWTHTQTNTVPSDRPSQDYVASGYILKLTHVLTGPGLLDLHPGLMSHSLKSPDLENLIYF